MEKDILEEEYCNGYYPVELKRDMATDIEAPLDVNYRKKNINATFELLLEVEKNGRTIMYSTNMV